MTCTKRFNSIKAIGVQALIVASLVVLIRGQQFQQQPQRPNLRPQRGSIRALVQPQTQNGPSSIADAPLPAVNSPTASNRTVRNSDIFKNGDGYNIFVTNTCERESMKVNIKTSREFYGIIHTRDFRQKPICSVEGTGAKEYNLEISHVLNQQDPAHCGVIRVHRESPEDKDTLSVVVAVRVHRNIELSDDKFFLLNCTNRCRKPDCSSPSAKLLNEGDDVDSSGGERESGPATTGLEGGRQGGNGTGNADECTIWKFPWAITLLWCLAILLLAMIISHCIMCSSMMCRCVKTEVEDREPSIYEGASDDEDPYNKRHPYRIEYDNKDIYKTENNYDPYDCEDEQTQTRHKRRHKHR